MKKYFLIVSIKNNAVISTYVKANNLGKALKLNDKFNGNGERTLINIVKINKSGFNYLFSKSSDKSGVIQ